MAYFIDDPLPSGERHTQYKRHRRNDVRTYTNEYRRRIPAIVSHSRVVSGDYSKCARDLWKDLGNVIEGHAALESSTIKWLNHTTRINV